MAKNNSKNKHIKKTKVSIIILAINSLDLIKSELVDLSKLVTTNIEIECVIVDNGSSDGLAKYLKSFKLPNMSLNYIQNGSNLGFSGGNNVGIRQALIGGADYVLLLNNDMMIKKDLITKLVNFMSRNPNAGIVSPKIFFAKGYEFHQDRYKDDQKGKVVWHAGGKVDWDNIYTSHIGVDEVDSGQFDKVRKTELASGACMFIKREVLEKVGLLDEGLFLYWEDADFCIRAKRFGFDIYYFPEAQVWHKVSISSGGSGSSSNDYFLTRNRFFFTVKYAKFRTKFAVLRDTLKLAFFGREWQRKGAIDALLGRKWQGSWIKK